MKKLSPAIVALISLFAYAIIVTLIFLITYGVLPAGSMITVILVTAVVGAMPLLVNFIYAGYIFYTGCVIGFLIDSLFVKSLAPTEPVMTDGGWLLIIIMAVGLIAGMATEIVKMRERLAAKQNDLPVLEEEAIEEEAAAEEAQDPDFKKYDE